MTPDMLPATLRDETPEINKQGTGLLDNHMDILPGMNSPLNASIDKRIVPLNEVEKFYIERAIELCDGNISQSAKYLGINPSTIYRKLQQWREQS
jgi:two-component system repressor protein LuxO